MEADNAMDCLTQDNIHEIQRYIKQKLTVLSDISVQFKVFRSIWWDSSDGQAISRKTNAWNRFTSIGVNTRYLEYITYRNNAEKIKLFCRWARPAKNDNQSRTDYFCCVQSQRATREQICPPVISELKSGLHKQTLGNLMSHIFVSVHQFDGNNSPACFDVFPSGSNRMSSVLLHKPRCSQTGVCVIKVKICRLRWVAFSHTENFYWSTGGTSCITFRESIRLPRDWKTVVVTQIHNGSVKDMLSK